MTRRKSRAGVSGFDARLQEGKALGWAILEKAAMLVSPQTILKWHRMLIARKYNSRTKEESPRARRIREMRELVLRMVSENSRWGYRRIQGGLKCLGLDVSHVTVYNIQRRHGQPCLDHMIFIGEKSLHRAINEYTEHYHDERPHQGLENNIIEFAPQTASNQGLTQVRERLGELLKYTTESQGSLKSLRRLSFG